MKKLLALSFSLTAVLVLLVWVSSTLSASQDKVAPDFKLKTLDGKTVTLADYEGKVVFLNFWATWCPPCRQEIPDFIEAYDNLKNEGLVILGVAVSDKENNVKNYVEKNKMNYPIAMGDMKIVQDYEPGNAIPTTIVIGRDGKIYHKQVGIMDLAQVEGIFKELSK